MISSIVSRLVILLCGTLYPAYASYKAVRTKDVREYVKWMMYWIVFALFTCAETFTDVFLSFWFPFYYELKIIVVLWLLSPATKGSSILYRKFVHPTLTKKEKEIDEAIMLAKAQGYSTILRLGASGVNYARHVIMQAAIQAIQHPPKSQPLQPLVSEASTRTVVDGPSASNGNGHLAHNVNEYNMFKSSGAMDQLDQLDAFQYSDDEDVDYIPPVVLKQELQQTAEQLIEEEEEPRTRPKRRSARSRKQTKPVQYEDYDFEEGP